MFEHDLADFLANIRASYDIWLREGGIAKLTNASVKGTLSGAISEVGKICGMFLLQTFLLYILQLLHTATCSYRWPIRSGLTGSHFHGCTTDIQHQQNLMVKKYKD